jgi:hypothetical protein
MTDVPQKCCVSHAFLEERDRRYKEKFEAMEGSIRASALGTDKALEIARMSVEKRFDSVNEFRQALTEQTATFLRRSEYIIEHKSLTEKIELLMRKVEAAEGKGAGLSSGWAYLVSAIALAGTVVGAFFSFSHH